MKYLSRNATTLLPTDEQRTTDFGTPATPIAPTTVPLQSIAAQGSFAVYGESFAVRTADATPAFFDLTELACAVVDRCGITHGTLTASTRHTTCAMVVQESEPLLLDDMADRLRRYASADEVYRHNDFNIRTVNMCDGECANGHAHCQHLLLGASVTCRSRMANSSSASGSASSWWNWTAPACATSPSR